MGFACLRVNKKAAEKYALQSAATVKETNGSEVAATAIVAYGEPVGGEVGATVVYAPVSTPSAPSDQTMFEK